MLKKLLLALIVVWVAGASYVYYQSQQKPTDVYVATHTVGTGDMLSGDVVTTTAGDVFTTSSGAVLGWKATKPGGFHTGTVVISEGTIAVESGVINAGSFVLDMTSVQLLDMDNDKFEGEIRDDFFQAPTNPTSTFVITKTENQWSGLVVYGDLTIKGVTKAINFPATVTMNGNTVQFAAAFAIDRLLRGLTMWEGKVNNYLEFNFDLSLTK